MAVTVCDTLLSSDIVAGCGNDSQIGFNRNAWLFNKEEITTESEGENSVDFSMKAGKRGYKVSQIGKKPFEGTNTALVVGTYRNSFTNQVKLHIPDNADVASVIDEISSGKFVAILDNGAGGLRVYGWYNGLTATEVTNDPSSEDTDGGWVVTLEETKAKKARLSFDRTAEDLDLLCKTPA
jgi:hypothetical protein